MDGTPLTLAAGPGGGIGVAIGLIVLLGVGAQWIAWRLKLPSILLLLLFGIIAGPVLRAVLPEGHLLAIDPDSILGADLLLALAGLAVGLILYEGGLTLNFRELKNSWKPVALLVTVGGTVTGILAGLAAKFIFGLSTPIAIQLGAVLIVTGPTVVGPMLNHIRPAGATGLILKWEGIVIDPIGVGVAVLVFEAIALGPEMRTFSGVMEALTITVVVGTSFGLLAAFVLREVISRFWVPDSLQNPVSLMLVVATFTASNQFQQESGLLATTVMGVVLANQKKVDVHHILEFKENLRVLLIALLFIILAARLQLDDLLALDPWAVLGFLAVLILVVRPVSVFIATIGTGLRIKERLFLSWVAPRGIVAAAGASVFALGLEKAGIAGAEKLVPLTFTVIIGTVAFYGLTAAWGARLLGISDQNPQGVLFVGAPRWVRQLALALHDQGVRVLLVDTNRSNISAARMDGLPAQQTNVLTVNELSEIDLRGIGRVLAVTPNDEVNILILQRFKGYFDTAGLYHIVPKAAAKKEGERSDRRFRQLFDATANHQLIESRLAAGWVFKRTTLSSEFTYREFRSLYGPTMVPVGAVSPSGNLTIATTGRPFAPSPGDTVIAIVNPEELLMSPLGLDDDEEDADGEPDGAAPKA
tara:strand:- start:13429 stop:15360 length:1932 start_codon:yes stop_codon:yes gene_type:complete